MGSGAEPRLGIIGSGTPSQKNTFKIYSRNTGATKPGNILRPNDIEG